MNQTQALVSPWWALAAGLILYFVIGLVRDWLATMFYRSVSREWAGSASILSGVITLFDIIILASVIVSGAFIYAFSYALGTGVGTWVAMKTGRRK